MLCTNSMDEKRLHFLENTATLVGTIIGAGVLGLPYTAARAGFWVTIAYIVGLGLMMLLVNLLLGEVVLKTRGHHQLCGLAERHLGKVGKYCMALSMVVGIYGALAAYTVGVGQTVSNLTTLSPVVGGVVFYMMFLSIIWKSLDVLECAELLFETMKIIAVVLIAVLVLSSPSFSMENLQGIYWNNVLYPFGIVLFAFLGTATIPELHYSLKNNTVLFKKVILLGSTLPIIIYALFVLLIQGIGGTHTQPIATLTLGMVLGVPGMIMGSFFAIIAIVTSAIALGFCLKEMYQYDFHFSKMQSWFLTVLVPPLLLLWNASFETLLEIAGAVAGGIVIILILLMHAKRSKAYVRNAYKITLPLSVRVLIGVIAAVGAISAVVNVL